MKQRISYFQILIIIAGMIVLILDSKTALLGASQGLGLCIRSIIPSLLPFFVLSSMLTGKLSGRASTFLAPLGKLCSIPPGQEVFLLNGWLGGYPVGAQNIYRAYSAGAINQADAKRLLSFCSNAGPSFIFGITAVFFTTAYIPWVLWANHIISSLLVGILLPKTPKRNCDKFNPQSFTLQQALTHSIKALATVCGWVVLMRIVIAFFQRWLLWLLPDTAAVILTGILELANGCCELSRIPAEPTRFLVCNGLLSFGGICVWLQTKSVTHELGTGTYLLGKILQTLISTLISLMLLPFVFPNEDFKIVPALLCVSLCTAVYISLFPGKRKKEVAFSANSMYNNLKSS